MTEKQRDEPQTQASAQPEDVTSEILDIGYDCEYRLNNRDYLPDFDWDAQLAAVRSVLASNRLVTEQASAKIAQPEERARTYSGPHHEHVVYEHIDAMHRFPYSAAAVSLSAIGMIAPMVESFFFQSFQSLGSKYDNRNMEPPEHERWRRADDHEKREQQKHGDKKNWQQRYDDLKKKRWNCEFYCDGGGYRKGLACGICQLSEATGLAHYLEEEQQGTMDWIKAVVPYRNKMFHCGLEWPLEERNKFKNSPQEWYAKCQTNDKPWMFILRDEVIDEMPERMQSIINGFDKFVMEEFA